MADWWDAAPKASTIDVASDAEGASPQVADLARSIYHQESGSGKNTTTSNAGAVGGMQIIPSTFHSVADPDWSIHDPVQNARAGVRYITQLLDKAGGDPALAAAGYYGGPGAIDKARKGIAVSDPRNPNAPNTLQYGQQVVSRMNGGGGSGSNWWSSAPLADDGSDAQAPQTQDPDQVPNATPGVSQDAAYGFNTQGQSAGTQAQPDVPQAPQDAPSQAGQAWHQIINGVSGAVLHPLDTAAKVGTAVKNGAVDFGQSMYDHPGQTIDNVVRGIADTATFGAADKIAAKADQLTGRTGDATYDQNLAAQRAQDQAGGAAFHVGQLGGAFLPGVGQVGLAAHAVEAVPTASRLLKLGAGAGAGAAEGTANYLGHNDGPVNYSDLSANAALGTLGGTVLGAMNKHTGDQMAESFARKAAPFGEHTSVVAEVTKDLQELQNQGTRGSTPLGPQDANALANKYTQDAAEIIRQTPKDADRQTLLSALNSPRALSADEIAGLRQLPNGDAVADAIQKRNVAMAMTAASPAKSNRILTAGRQAVDNGLMGTAAYASGHPIIGMALNSGFARNLAGRLLGGRETRTGNIESWLKQGDNATAYLDKYGPSAASQSAQGLQTGLQQMQNFQGPMPQGSQGSAMQGARQTAAAQAALAKAQAARDAQQAANLTNSVKVRQQQAAARRAAATAQANQVAQAQTTVEAQAAQQAQAEQARAAQYAQQRQQQSAQARQQQAAQDAQAQQEVAAQQAAQAASQQRANQYAQQRQAQSAEARAAQPTPVDPAVSMAQQAQAAKDRLAARVAARQASNTADNVVKGRTAAAEAAEAETQAKVSKVASGDFSDVDINKPQVKALLDYVDHPDLDSVKASLSALAAQDPAMGKKIVQLLTPGAPNLKKLDFYGIQKRLQDIHGSKVPPEAAVASGDGALSSAVQNPQAYQAQINRRQAQVSHAVTQAPTPEMAVVAHQMGGEASPVIKQQAFEAVMAKASDNEKEYLKKFVEPLIKYGK